MLNRFVRMQMRILSLTTFVTGQKVLVKKSSGIGSASQLAGKKVLTVKGVGYVNDEASLVNQFVATLKETSLGYVIIGLTEVSFIATQINTQVFTRSAEVYGLLALTFFVLCFSLSRFAFWAERRLVPKR